VKLCNIIRSGPVFLRHTVEVSILNQLFQFVTNTLHYIVLYRQFASKTTDVY